MMRWIVSKSLQFRYVILVLAAGLMIFGLMHLRETPIDVFPEFAPPLVEVQTEGPGMSASEIESLITIFLEDSFNNIPNLDVMRSRSAPGVSAIQLIFKPDMDVLVARQLVQERLNVAIRNLPTWAGIPWMLQPLSATSRVMHIGLTTNKYSLTDLSMITYWTIRWRLMTVPGVANVVIWGDRFKQMQIEVDPAKLLANHVTVDDMEEIASDALDFGLLKFTDNAKTRVGGFIETANQRLNVQHVLPVIEPSDLAKLPISSKTTTTGAPLTLGDLGQVVWGHQPIIGDSVINDTQGLLLIVEKFPWANTLAVTQGVDTALQELKTGLPDIKINADIFRPAKFIEISVHNLTRSLLISCLLVMIVLSLFLYEWRTTLISLVAIPLSLVTAGLIIGLKEITINTMILAGFVIAIGGVVDDAIIDVENILRRLRLNAKAKKKQAIITLILNASLEIRGAIIYAVLIDIAVLLPVFFLTGVSGAFFKPLVTAYALALLASMIIALTVTPALCLLLLKNTPLQSEGSPILKWIQKKYEKAHSRLIYRGKTVASIIIILILSGVVLFPLLGESLFPAFKESYFLNHWVTMPGTSSTEVLRMNKLLSNELLKTKGVINFGSHIGRAVQGEEISGINFAENWISIDPNMNYDETMERIEKVVDSYTGLFHDVQTYLNERIDEVVAGSSYPIVIRIFGPDLSELRKQAEEITAIISKIKGTSDVHTELQIDIPHISVEVDLLKAQRFGLKPGDVRRIAATLIAGTEVSDIHRSGKVYDIMLWGTENTRRSVEAVKSLLISTPNGDAVPLDQVANVSIKPTPNIIERENNSRKIDVLVDNKERDLNEVVGDVKETLQNYHFPLGYYADVLGEYEEREAAESNLLLMGIGSAVLVLLLLQAAFNSWRLSFLAFVTLPSALVGGLLATFLTDGVISLGSLVGFFTVFGIAARNAIMLINHYQYIEKYENEPFGPDLILRGVRERLAPILMTAIAAGLALIPLAISGNIPGQEIEYPMAIVILGGLITSTFLNLFIMPFLYFRFGGKKG